MLQVFYELTNNVFVEMQTVRYQGFEVGTAAAVAEVHTGHIPFDDPGGLLDIKGWRKVRVYETTATPTLLWSGRIRNKTVKRGDSDRASLRTGADRWWDCDAADQNTLVGSRIIRDGNRPAETAGERLAWLLSTSFTVLHDEGHVTYPTYRMDPADYTLQTAADLIADCAQPGGYNFFAMQVDTLDATDTPELFFMLPTSSDWASSISISDDLADVDNVTVFAPNYEAEMLRADEIIAEGVAVPYNGTGDNDYVYVDDSAIGDEFAYVNKVAPMANVKTSAKATVIAYRHLALSATEADKITCEIHVPASLANALRPWHRVAYKSTWMPGYSSYVDCRVIDWAIRQQAFPGGGEGYIISLELSPIAGTAVTCSTVISSPETSDTHSTVGTSPTDSITPADDTVLIAWLIGNDNDIPAATDMTAITGGYTEIFDMPANSRSTWRIATKAATGGVLSTAAATFTPGFGGGQWLALHVALAMSSEVPVQTIDGNGYTATLSSTPTVGNIVLVFAYSDGAATLSPNTDINEGPTTGWVQLYQRFELNGNASLCAAVFARCVGEGETGEYAFQASGFSTSHGISIAEFVP